MISEFSFPRRFSAPRPQVDWVKVTDAELVIAARRGDRAGKEAFVEIVRRHQMAVCAVACSVTGRIGLTDDIAQEAFLNAWNGLDKLREPTKLKAWLMRIVHDCAVRAVRRERPHVSLEDEEVSLAEVPGPGPDQAMADKEEERFVWSALAGLPENLRTPLVLFYCEGKSVAAVAEALDLSGDAVKQRLSRGRNELRSQVAAMMAEKLESRLESVLGRVRPPGLLVVTVAAGIGLLSAPAVVAGSAFAAASAATSTGPSATAFAATMSISKTSLAIAALVTAVCISVGYRVPRGKEPPVVAATGSRGEAATQQKAPPGFEGSALFAQWKQLHDTYGTTAEAMPDLYHAIADLKDPFSRRAFRAMLIAEWVQLDPASGLTFFLGKNGDASQRRQFLEEWLARDAGAAVDALMVSGSGWQGMARDSLTEIARRVPARMADIVARLPKSDTSHQDTKVRDAFAIVAESGLASARAAAEAMTGPNRDQALAGVAKAWARSDLNGAIAWAKTLPDGTDRDEVIRAALMGKSATDPAAALELAGLVPAGGKPDSTGRTTGARVLEEAANADFDTTVAWLTAHPGRLVPADMRGLESALTERLNKDAAGFLTKYTAAGSLSAMLPGIEGALVNSASGQRAAVWDWLKTQPEDDTTKALKKKVLTSAASQDPELALRLAIEVPRNPEGDLQLEMMANNFFNGGLNLHRFEHLISQAPDRLKKPLAESAFNRLNADTMDDPHLWIDRLSLLSEASRTRGIQSIATAWAEQAPEGAIGWVDSMPAGEARSGAVAGIISTWAAKDSEGASAWVASMPAGAERDRSAHSLVFAIADKFPREAWEWAVSIGDAERRATAATQAARMMARDDLSTAQQWIESGPFTPEMRATLRSKLGPAAPPSGTR